MAKDSLTPGSLVSELREHQKSNKEIKALYANQFFGQMSYEELAGLKKSVQKEIDKRANTEIQKKIEYLKKQGFEVKKK